MALTPIVCWGAKGQARVLRDFFPALGFDLIALFDNDANIKSPFSDVPLIGGWSSFAPWREKHPGPISCIVAIGGPRGSERTDIQQRLIEAGLQPASVVHPTAFVSKSASFGPGSQILALAAVCVDAHLGDACIVNTKASVDHETTVGNGVHIGPGAVLCGEVVVEDFAFIGAGATILPRVRIGRGAIVGAGAVVTRDVAPEARVVSVHARALDPT